MRIKKSKLGITKRIGNIILKTDEVKESQYKFYYDNGFEDFFEQKPKKKKKKIIKYKGVELCKVCDKNPCECIKIDD